MSTIITSGADTLEPTLVTGYASRREARSIVHTILGRENPDVTFRPASLRSGQLELLFTGESESLDAEQLHATGQTFALISTDRASVEMTYVVADGTIERELDDATRDVWIVRVPFQEVTP
jgi:hypothetical protein